MLSKAITAGPSQEIDSEAAISGRIDRGMVPLDISFGRNGSTMLRLREWSFG